MMTPEESAAFDAMLDHAEIIFDAMLQDQVDVIHAERYVIHYLVQHAGSMPLPDSVVFETCNWLIAIIMYMSACDRAN